MSLLAALSGRRFPGNQPAIAMETVLEGELPALLVQHTVDGLWLISDGVNEPDDPDKLRLVHLSHVVEQDRSLNELARLERGFQAVRAHVGGPWTHEPFRWADDEEDPTPPAAR